MINNRFIFLSILVKSQVPSSQITNAHWLLNWGVDKGFITSSKGKVVFTEKGKKLADQVSIENLIQKSLAKNEAKLRLMKKNSASSNEIHLLENSLSQTKQSLANIRDKAIKLQGAPSKWGVTGLELLDCYFEAKAQLQFYTT